MFRHKGALAGTMTSEVDTQEKSTQAEWSAILMAMFPMSLK
jgi:hypothetical protein